MYCFVEKKTKISLRKQIFKGMHTTVKIYSFNLYWEDQGNVGSKGKTILGQWNYELHANSATIISLTKYNPNIHQISQ